jgi:hypothetical protein
MALAEEDYRSRALTAATTLDINRSVATYSAGNLSDDGYDAAGDDHDSDADEHPVLQRVMRWIWVSRVVAVLSLLTIVGFTVGLAVKPAVVRDYVMKYSALDNSDSKFWPAWQNAETVGVPVFRRYYFYNVTNPFEVMEGVAPNVVEVGPFVYREVTQKYDVRWYLNGSVAYKYKRLTFFAPEQSVDELTGRQLDPKVEVMTVLNPALKGILYRVGKLAGSEANKLLGLEIDACTYLDLLVNNTVVGPMGFFSQHTPDEFLWGYVDKLWNEVHWLLPNVGYDASTVFQCQWNGTAVVPSPYSYRAGMRCPLWQDQAACNGSSVGYTMEVSGRKGDQVRVPASQQMQPPAGTWLPLNPGVDLPPGAPLPTPLQPFQLDPTQHGAITQWAGQRSLWLWGPVLDGLTGGEDLHPRDTWHAPAKKKNAWTLFGAEDFDDEPLPPTMNSAAQCRSFSGTDATRFPPLQPGGGTLDVFVDMIGRSFQFADAGRHHLHGIEVNRYTFSDATLADSPENRFCYGGRFKGLFNLSRPAFGPGIASLSYYQRSCFEGASAPVAGSPTGARRCTDRLWEGDDGVTNTDDGFTGPSLTANITFAVPAVSDPARAAPLHTSSRPNATTRLTMDEYLTARAGGSDPATLRRTYANHVDVNQLTGIVINGRSDAMVSLALGPMTVDGCGRNFTYALLNRSVAFFNQSYQMPRTTVPFLRLVREASAQGKSLREVQDAFALLNTIAALLWTGLSCGILGLFLSAALRLLYVPHIAAGDPAMYDADSNLISLGASQRAAAMIQDN